MGSTAYNRSAGGPIVPMGAGVVVLTTICPFHPRSWKGAVLPERTEFRFDVRDSARRPVNAIADNQEAPNVTSASSSSSCASSSPDAASARLFPCRVKEPEPRRRRAAAF